MSIKAYTMIANLLSIFHGVVIAMLVSSGYIIVYTDIPTWYFVAIITIAIISVFGFVTKTGCPLSNIEYHFRSLAGDKGYDGAFINHWLEKIFRTKFSHHTHRHIEMISGIILGAILISIIVSKF